MGKAMIAAIETKEVSLVGAGANRRVFAITKSERQQMDEKILKAVLGTKAKGEEELIASLKTAGKSEDQIQTAVAGMRFLLGFKDNMDGEQLAMVAKSAGIALPVEKADPEDVKPDPKPAPELETVRKQYEDELVEVRKSNTDLASELKATNERVTKLMDEKLTVHAVNKAKTLYSNLGDSTELGDFLKKLGDADSALLEQAEKVLSAANTKIDKAALFAELGSAGGEDPTDGTPEGELDRIAKTIVAKSLESGEPISYFQAYDMAMEANKGLYTKSIQEKRTKGAH